MSKDKSVRQSPPLPVGEKLTVHGTLIRKALEKLTNEVVKSREEIVAAVKEQTDRRK
jgi:hypothetical protein